jgi:hypothetical protein
MPEFSVQFDREPFEALDQLALLACQDYNLSNASDWFGEFRGGLYGFYARLHGVEQHYFQVHAWQPRVRIPTDTEYHLASILFQMDSAFECLTFALNAIGWVAMPTGFRDVTDAKALRQISPLDILGNTATIPPTKPLAGYRAVFPTLQAAWQNDAPLIGRVRNLHDVSKHRRTIFVGGQARLDPPDGFYEALGLSEDPRLRAPLWPMAEIILQEDPKTPAVHRTPKAVRQSDLLENLVPSFAVLISATGTAALGDAQVNVPLKEKQFRG